MEFLDTVHHVGEYWLYLIVIIIVFVFLLIFVSAGIWEMITNKSLNELPPVIVISLIAILIGYGGLVQIDHGPNVTHKVLITDFNEVYNQGYEIIGQEGEIYTIQKKTGD